MKFTFCNSSPRLSVPAIAPKTTLFATCVKIGPHNNNVLKIQRSSEIVFDAFHCYWHNHRDPSMIYQIAVKGIRGILGWVLFCCVFDGTLHFFWIFLAIIGVQSLFSACWRVVSGNKPPIFSNTTQLV